MGKGIIPPGGEHEWEEARGWEGKVYRQVCQQGQGEAVRYLEGLDEELYRQRPTGWIVEGFRGRTLVTRFGEVSLRRRLYRDERGEYHFLLDEYLGWKANQVATPEMQAIGTLLGGELSFRRAVKVMEQCMAGLLSASTCWRLLQSTGEAATTGEAAVVEAVFARGEAVPEEGERQVERLYIEADGVYVRLQRQPRSHLELHSAIAYEGWERLPDRREGYRLSRKWAYCHAGERFAFWEGASLAWAHQWDLGHLRTVVIGGDGAEWIRAGVKEFPGAVWQLDSFHLARACRQSFGVPVGQILFQALRAGLNSQVQTWLQQAPLPEGKQAQRAFRWVRKVAQEGWGLDWRVQLDVSEEETHGLGCMEGNQAHLLARRMKGKGRSWCPDGARHMAKVQN